jgi:hypothetical protein
MYQAIVQVLFQMRSSFASSLISSGRHVLPEGRPRPAVEQALIENTLTTVRGPFLSFAIDSER